MYPPGQNSLQHQWVGVSTPAPMIHVVPPPVIQRHEIIDLPPKEIIQEEVSPQRYPVRNYYEYSESGSDACYFLRLSLRKSRLRRMLESGEIQQVPVKIEERRDLENMMVLKAQDLTDLRVTINHTNGINHLCVNERSHQSFERTGLRYSLVGRHIRRIQEGRIGDLSAVHRMIPKDLVSNYEELGQLFDDINKFLMSDIDPEFMPTVPNFLVDNYVVATNGQLLYALSYLQEMRTLKGKSTKLFIRALCMLARPGYGDPNMMLASVCNWFAADTCDSCFEKTLFLGARVTYQYTQIQFIPSDRDFSVVEDASLHYTILSHDDASWNELPPGWVVHEHSSLTIVSLYAKVSFRIGRGPDASEISTNVHRGMSLILSVDGVVRAARKSINGYRDKLFNEWLVQHHLMKEDFKKLREVILDLVVLEREHPSLSRLVRNVLFCVVFGVVPQGLINPERCQGEDLYSVVTSRAMFGISPYVDFRLKPLLNNSSFDHVMASIGIIPLAQYHL